jgi:hypothetical protein
MTKKSLARRKRDAAKAQQAKGEQFRAQARAHAKEQLQDNTCWDELNEIRQKCGQMLAGHVLLAQTFHNKELLACVDDQQTLSQLIQQLTRDLQSMNAELGEIASQHAGKTGGTDDPDVVISTIAIFEQYNLFMERHQQVVIPTAMHISEFIDQAGLKLAKKQAEAQAAAQATDPTVVTDVAFKEVDAAAPAEG